MKYSIISIICVLSTGSCLSEKEVNWIITTPDNTWTEYHIASSAKEILLDDAIIIDPENVQQEIDGFGGCFNEMGWEALKTIPDKEQQTVLRSLFDPKTGCDFSICRMPIGANDYALDWYSHNETPEDYSMEHFSIDRDRLRLIPYIHAAQKIQPDLKVWASPWCPSSWMKTNQHYACHSNPQVNDLPENKQGEEMKDQFIMNDPTLSAYALYFSRFVSEYKQEGIPIYAVHVQNEPNSCQHFPSCIWTPSGLARFIGQYLGPRFEKDQLTTEIWLGTIERPQIERIDTVLHDTLAKKYIKGVGFQWAGKDAIPLVREKYPQMSLMQTETECGDGANDWKAMEHTWSLMKHYFQNGANAYMYWNMILDETGKSHWGWKQNSMITIDSQHRAIYNPEFYLMKHFSHFIKKSSRFIRVSSNKNILAFLNPDNEVIVVFYNEKDMSTHQSFLVGKKTIQVELLPKSINTFIIKT